MKLIISLLLCSVLLCACGTMSDNPSQLPRDAQIKQDLGNGWVIFELDHKQFLYHKGWAGYEAITQIK